MISSVSFRANPSAILFKKEMLSRRPLQQAVNLAASHRFLSSSRILGMRFRTPEEKHAYLFTKIKSLQSTKEQINKAQKQIAELEGLSEVYMKVIRDHLSKEEGNPNIFDEDGNTPLHLAAAMDHPKLVEVLLTHGADRSAKNSQGKLPLNSEVSSPWIFD